MAKESELILAEPANLLTVNEIEIILREVRRAARLNVEAFEDAHGMEGKFSSRRKFLNDRKGKKLRQVEFELADHALKLYTGLLQEHDEAVRHIR